MTGRGNRSRSSGDQRDTGIQSIPKPNRGIRRAVKLEGLRQSVDFRATGIRGMSIVATTIIILVVALFAAFAVPSLVGAEESFVVLSGSMEPNLSPGDVIFVYAVEPEEIVAGDIVTYSPEGSTIPVTHRVLEVVRSEDFQSGVGIRTKGDANEEADPAFRSASTVIGRVPMISLPTGGVAILAIPYLGYVIEFGNTGPGFITLVALPLVLFIVNEAWGLLSPTRSSRFEPRGDEVEDSPAASSDPITAGSPVGYVVIGGADGGLRLSSRTLTLLSGVFGVVMVAAGWLALNDMTAWSVSATVGAFGVFVFTLSLRHLALNASDAPESHATGSADFAPGGAGAERIVTASLPPVLAERPKVAVDSRDELLEYASVLGRLVLSDAEEKTLYLPDGEIVYTAPITSERDTSNSGGEYPIEQPPLAADGNGSGIDVGSGGSSVADVTKATDDA